MNYIELLYSEGRKDELLELFDSLQLELREANTKIQKLEIELELKDRKLRQWRKRYNQVLSEQ